MVVRRLVLVLSIVFCGTLAAAAAAMAAGGGGGLAPGTFTFTNTSANAFFGGAKGGPPQPSFDVFVSHGLNSFQPDDGPVTVMQNTIVQFTEFNATGAGGSACFIIPDGDFTVAGGLKSAALHTMLTAAELCPGPGSPVGATSTASPLGGGGGGLVLPIKVDITWQGSGVIAATHDEFSFTCLQIEEEGSNSFADAIGSSASGAIGSASGLTTLAADISSQNGNLQVQGTATPPCFGK